MIQRLLATATQRLAAASATPRLDAELLLAHVAGWTRARMLAARDEPLPPEHVAAFEQLVARRAALEPVAYLIGHREFFGLDVQVDRRVLVPRPETELLVELTLEQAQARLPRPEPLHIVDVGTGSGAIALALAVHLPNVRLTATDIFPGALEVTAANLAHHRVQEQVTLLHGDLLAPLTEQADIIVSNPPYTILSEIDENVRRHEPHLALDGGPDGLALYRRLLEQVPRWLSPGGALLLEIGAAQAAMVSSLMRAALPEARVTIHRDLAGHPRVVVGEHGEKDL